MTELTQKITEQMTELIPKKIFQTWFTKEFPPKMKECVDDLKRKHPDFEYFFFDDDESREFIQTNFDEEVLFAFDTLIPGAFKADLWRYCVLYIHGGVYLDIKFNTCDSFTLHQFLDKEYYVRDLPTFGLNGVYNAFMICTAGNPMLLQAIHQVVENVKNRYYGRSPLDVSGPEMLLKYFTNEDVNNFEFYLELGDYSAQANNYICKIMNKGECVLKMYDEYFQERNEIQTTAKYHSNLWKQGNIYY